ncbi:MAG TPA: type VI secretion system tube protein Hcp [Nitrospira sp.]|nr:type VI secretion system tube protein Hcp [Nitrospira sp.]
MAVKQEYMFLKLGDIKGNATTVGFEDQIVLQNMSYGISQRGSWEEGAQLSGRVTTFSDVSFVKLLDVASPSIATACAAKQQFLRAEISVTAGTKDAYYKLTLEKVLVTSISTAISAGEGHPSESFTLSFRKGIWEYGKARGGYDLETNQKA